MSQLISFLMEFTQLQSYPGSIHNMFVISIVPWNYRKWVAQCGCGNGNIYFTFVWVFQHIEKGACLAMHFLILATSVRRRLTTQSHITKT